MEMWLYDPILFPTARELLAANSKYFFEFSQKRSSNKSSITLWDQKNMCIFTFCILQGFRENDYVAMKVITVM